MLNKLRLKLTFISIIITTFVLMIMSTCTIVVNQKQFDSHITLSLETQLTTLIYYLQTSSMINDQWLKELELSNKLIVHIEDNHYPLLFKGSYRTSTERSSLISLAKEMATQTYSFDFYSYKYLASSMYMLQFELHTDNHEHFLVGVASVGSTDKSFQLVLLKDLKEDDNTRLVFILLFILLTIVCIIVLLIFSLWFAGKAIHPIEENNRKQKEFIAAASHELRSPLTVIQTSAAALSPEQDENVKFIGFILEECHSMSRLISDLLLLTNADAKSNWTLHLEMAEVDTLLLEIYDHFYEIALQRRHSLNLKLPDLPITKCLLDTERIKQVITILLDNAFSYTPDGCAVTLSLTELSHNLYIKVIDNGPGIPDTAKKKIFDRFYRLDPSRHQKGHYGLGLSIAYEIIQLHQGFLTLEDTPNGGCTFVITLPIKML